MGVASSKKPTLAADEEATTEKSAAKTKKDQNSDQPKNPPESASSSSHKDILADNSSNSSNDLDTYLDELSTVKNGLEKTILRLMDEKQKLGLSDEDTHTATMQNIEMPTTILEFIENKFKALAKQFLSYVQSPDIVIEKEEEALKAELDLLRSHRNPLVSVLSNKDITAEDKRKYQAQLLAIDLAMARQLQNFLIEMEREIAYWIKMQKIAINLAINLICFVVRTVTGLTPPAYQITDDNELKVNVEGDIENDKVTIDDLITDTNADIKADEDLILKDSPLSSSPNSSVAAKALYAGTQGIKVSRSSSPIFSRPSNTSPVIEQKGQTITPRVRHA